MGKTCPYCFSGKISVDGGSLSYRCPDCEGQGFTDIEDVLEDDRYLNYELED